MSFFRKNKNRKPLAVLMLLIIVAAEHQKTTLTSGLVNLTDLLIDWPDNLIGNISQGNDFVNSGFLWAWTCRELNPVDLGYQTSLASLPSPRHIQYNKFPKRATFMKLNVASVESSALKSCEGVIRGIPQTACGIEEGVKSPGKRLSNFSDLSSARQFCASFADKSAEKINI